MLTFAQIKSDPSLVGAYGTNLILRCSRTACVNEVTLPRYQVRKRLAANCCGIYCSRACVNRDRLDTQVTTRDGVEGRVCQTCKEWKALPLFDAKGRSPTCGRCKRAKPDQVFSVLRSKAKHRGWCFELTQEEVQILLAQPCFYCGVVPTGLDRLDSKQGYIKGNVVAACQPCNFGKSNHNLKDFLAHCRLVASRL